MFILCEYICLIAHSYFNRSRTGGPDRQPRRYDLYWFCQCRRLIDADGKIRRPMLLCCLACVHKCIQTDAFPCFYIPKTVFLYVYPARTFVRVQGLWRCAWRNKQPDYKVTEFIGRRTEAWHPGQWRHGTAYSSTASLSTDVTTCQVADESATIPTVVNYQCLFLFVHKGSTYTLDNAPSKIFISQPWTSQNQKPWPRRKALLQKARCGQS
jgi:hypothetical protein